MRNNARFDHNRKSLLWESRGVNIDIELLLMCVARNTYALQDESIPGCFVEMEESQSA